LSYLFLNYILKVPKDLPVRKSML